MAEQRGMESRTRRYNHYHHYLLMVTNKEQTLREDVAVATLHHSYRVVLVWGFEDVGLWSLAVVNGAC